MARNVEIKTRLRDAERTRRIAEELADGPPEVIHQEDTFFRCRNGRLKLRRFSDGTGELIHYQREDSRGPCESVFRKVMVTEPDELAAALEAALGVAGRVEKQRTLLMTGRTRIHLDEVCGLGNYLELEVVLGESETVADGERDARDLMAQLGVARDDLVASAYVDLLAAGVE